MNKISPGYLDCKSMIYYIIKIRKSFYIARQVKCCGVLAKHTILHSRLDTLDLSFNYYLLELEIQYCDVK